MTVLVTGATGYVGRHLIARLRRDGVAVRAIVRRVAVDLPAEVGRHVVDLGTTGFALQAALDGVRAVVHAAAHLDGGGPADYRRVNVDGTAALLAAAAAAGVRRVVHLSTIAVYGRKAPGAVVGASDGYEPAPALRDDYAASKLGGDRWAECWRQSGGLDVVTLRPAIVHGRGRQFVARTWRPLGGRLRLVVGTPDMLLPLVHVDDLVEAVVRALQRSAEDTAPLTLAGPDAPTQAAWLARRQDGVRTVYLPPATLRRVSNVRRAHQLAWATQSVRYDRSACAQALGWAPRIAAADVERAA